jgi:hypothetical protein
MPFHRRQVRKPYRPIDRTCHHLRLLALGRSGDTDEFRA